MKKLLLPAFALILSLFLPSCKDNSSDPASGSAILSVSKLEIVNDDNDNGAANPGEQVAISVYIKNDGDADAENFYISRVKSLTDYITVDTYNNQYEKIKTIPAHKEISFGSTATFVAKIDKSIKADSSYKFWIQAKDDRGNVINDTLTLQVVKSGANIVIAGMEIDSDGNGNEAANRGETIHINLIMKNIGTNRADNLRITKIKSLSEFITIDNYSHYDISIGNLFAGQERTIDLGDSYLGIPINISNSIKVDSVYKIWFKIEDEVGGVWNDTLELRVVNTGAILKVSKLEIMSDQNNDGKVNPSESFLLIYSLKNTGTENASGVYMKNIQCSSPYVTNLSSSYAQWSSIMPGQETVLESNNARINGVIKSTAPVGTKIPFKFTISDQSGNEWTDTAEITVE